MMRRVKTKKSKKGWIIAAVIIMILLAVPKGSKNKNNETASKKETVQEKTETPVPEEKAEEIDAQFKENVDTCEQFIAGYAELLKKISGGDTSAETMETYTKALESYTKVSEWLNSVDTSKLNAAEAAYYNEAMLRMAGKLTEIAAFKPVETAAAEPEKETADENYIDPEFKAAMDSYEAFFDEYIALTNQIGSGDSSAETMMQYANYMAKYADVMQKLEDVNEDELTTAELLYYEEVMLRITQKLQALN